jgi:hypothetical protein
VELVLESIWNLTSTNKFRSCSFAPEDPYLDRMPHTAVREVADVARSIYLHAVTLSEDIPCCTFEMRKRKGIRSVLHCILMPSRSVLHCILMPSPSFGTTLDQLPLPLCSQPNFIVCIVSSHLLLEFTKSQLLPCLIRTAFATRRTILNLTILTAVGDKVPSCQCLKLAAYCTLLLTKYFPEQFVFKHWQFILALPSKKLL